MVAHSSSYITPSILEVKADFKREVKGEEFCIDTYMFDMEDEPQQDVMDACDLSMKDQQQEEMQTLTAITCHSFQQISGKDKGEHGFYHFMVMLVYKKRYKVLGEEKVGHELFNLPVRRVYKKRLKRQRKA